MTTRMILWLVLALWLVAMVASVLVARATTASDIGLTAGLNRIGIFLGFQLGAALIAVVAWTVGNGLSKGSWPRWLSRVPAILTLLMVAALVTVILVSLASKPDPIDPPGSPTVPVPPATTEVPPVTGE